MRRSGNSFRSPAFLGASFPNKAVVPFPQTDDPNLWAWWSANDYVTMQSPNLIFTVGNKADYQVSKTDRTPSGCTNLVPSDVNQEPFRSRADLLENFVNYSEDMTNGSWNVSNVTRNSATLVTFTAQNGYIRQQVNGYWHEGAQLTVTVQIRAVSGNTALQLQTESTYTNITVDGTLKEYTVTFTPSQYITNVQVGIRDPNAAGFGQIEITKWHVRRTLLSSSTYLQTTTDMQYASTVPTSIRSFIYHGKNFFLYAPGANALNSSTFSAYMTYRACPHASAGRIFVLTGGIYSYFVAQEGAPGVYRTYTAGPAAKEFSTAAGFTTDYQWCVLSFTATSGGTGSIRKNLGIATTGALASIVMPSGIQWGGYNYDGFHAQFEATDFIVRRGIDSADTQEAYVRYLAQKIGISV